MLPRRLAEQVIKVAVFDKDAEIASLCEDTLDHAPGESVAIVLAAVVFRFPSDFDRGTERSHKTSIRPST